MNIRLRQPYSFCQMGKRLNQEDARFPNEDIPRSHNSSFVVCDGVGGQDKGEIASGTVAESIGTYMSKIDLTRPFDIADFKKLLESAYAALDKQMDKSTREMATTMTFVCFHSEGALCAHIGDSRIYHIRPGVGILYQSDDHSLVNALVHAGTITPEEAIDHPKGNIITRCMGYVEKGLPKPAATTLQIDDIEAGDYFFLCSDGVLHQVDNDELVGILSSDMTDKEKTDKIRERSFSSSDNNTAYLIGVEEVIRDSESAGAANCNSDTEVAESPKTTPLENKHKTIIDITPNTDQKGHRLSDFFKNLFS